ncbi:hypothetical protein BDY19DRAFT_900159 [Irpex rosettiformis]|uniref:Uncharacterized protein n=1 Tax=Irpex rosettiformis TaxID=378272 RepID=A0ACB8TNF1_9APHY|nr:hypothetical protein BDY19DRAFT_900159 [Irpex rosettiformis]
MSAGITDANTAYEASLGALLNSENPYAPFDSKLDWEVGKWAKLRGPSETSFTELLGINGIKEGLNLSYQNARRLDALVDGLPSTRPSFIRGQVEVNKKKFDFYFRDILKCIKALYGDPEFAPHLVFVPERHYADEEHKQRLYHDMHTGDWWWSTQIELEKKNPGATIIPVIISSDKTQLTLFRNKSAYPVYITIGNLPKAIRRKGSRHGQILLGYLPAEHFDHITNKAERRRAVSLIFHACMDIILKPLQDAGINGILLASGDGVVRRCHPIFSNYIADYPEQVLVTLTSHGECPTCPIPTDELHLGKVLPPRELQPILDALRIADKNLTHFIEACKGVGIKAIPHPFWEKLPYANIYRSITPDILHQLYQGLVKHLLEWLMDIFGAAELDARCQRLPENHNVRLFRKGITNLQRVSGAEHAHISQILLGLIADLKLPDRQSSAQLIKAVRALLDFLFLARLPQHTTDTLADLDNAWRTWHENKQGFPQTSFNFPKAHNPGHYTYYIQLFGTTDNYNTENTERLHIDLAKDAYRSTNHRDEFIQMTRWVERREKIWRHDQYIRYRLRTPVTPTPQHPRIRVAKTPNVRAVSFDDIADKYGAPDIVNALASFVARTCFPNATRNQLRDAANQVHVPRYKVPTFYNIKISHPSADEDSSTSTTTEIVHVRPAFSDTRARAVAGRFDTVLVKAASGVCDTVSELRVAQVRVVFSLSDIQRQTLFGESHANVPSHLAYVEWFSKFTAARNPYHDMYKVKRSNEGDAAYRLAEIIPVEKIKCSIQLFPQFGPDPVSVEWTSDNVLEECESFYTNPFTSDCTYSLFRRYSKS